MESWEKHDKNTFWVKGETLLSTFPISGVKNGQESKIENTFENVEGFQAVGVRWGIAARERLEQF